MTYQELQTKMIDMSHRKDMTARVPGFIEDARVRLNSRLGLELVPLVAPTDTNDILTENYLLYYYAAMQSLYEFIVEYETASYFDGQFNRQADNFYVTAPGTTPLVITPEGPTP